MCIYILVPDHESCLFKIQGQEKMFLVQSKSLLQKKPDLMQRVSHPV